MLPLHQHSDGSYFCACGDQRFDVDEPSIENGDLHDGPHEYEDGYDDDGQGIVCVKCSAAKREAKDAPQDLGDAIFYPSAESARRARRS